jgi:hypothetical protein
MNATEKKYVTKRIEDEAKKHRENICGEGHPSNMPEADMWNLGFSGAVPMKPKFKEFLDNEPEVNPPRYHGHHVTWDDYEVRGPSSIWDFSAHFDMYKADNKTEKKEHDKRLKVLDAEVQRVLDELMIGSSQQALDMLTVFVATDF